jgi:hypothetical protein
MFGFLKSTEKCGIFYTNNHIALGKICGTLEGVTVNIWIVTGGQEIKKTYNLKKVLYFGPPS